jgi:threonine/homoserine/homoserine lactone efflux protein
MTFIPETSILLTYSVASVLLFVTPGPDMSLFLARTLVSGRRAGIASVMGANLGCIGHTLLSAYGVSALIAASQMGFLALKIFGAAYLLWLAFDAVRKGSSLNVQTETQKPSSALSSFLMGVTVNMTNPKVLLFFITFLPQFIDVHDPNVRAKLIFLGIYFVVINIPLSIIMILGAERLIEWLKARPKVLRGIDFSFAGVFAFFALKIALAQGK